MTGPSEVSVAMGQLAQIRTDKIIAQINSAPPAPAFQPSLADLLVPPPTPTEANRALWAQLTPAQARAETKAASDLLLGTQTARPPEPTWQPTPFKPNLVPQQETLHTRIAGVVDGGGGGVTTTQASLTYGNTIAKVTIDAWKAAYTGVMYLEWVRNAKYPWWWGPITKGLEQVEQMLIFDNDFTQRSNLPSVTKALYQSNISTAINWVREQRAAQAANAGGPPVPF